jgi:hypothetical protein
MNNEFFADLVKSVVICSSVIGGIIIVNRVFKIIKEKAESTPEDSSDPQPAQTVNLTQNIDNRVQTIVNKEQVYVTWPGRDNNSNVQRQQRYYQRQENYRPTYNQAFLNSSLERWNNLRRWIKPFRSVGIYTIRDVYSKRYNIDYYKRTIPGIGDKGAKILKEIANIAYQVDTGQTNIYRLGTNLRLDSR